MKASEHLEKGLSLLREKGWTQGVVARNADGRPVGALSASAACFCSMGAVRATRPPPYAEWWIHEMPAFKFLAEAMGGSVSRFNDHSTQEEVFAAWERAIQLAKEAGQ